MSFKYHYAKLGIIHGLQGAVDLNEAFIGGRLLGAFIAKDLLSKEEVEKWVNDQDKNLFYALGVLEGIKIGAPFLYNAWYHYTKAQAIATCVYKRYWRIKTYIKVEATGKTPEKADITDCQKFERPDCTNRDTCTTMFE